MKQGENRAAREVQHLDEATGVTKKERGTTGAGETSVGALGIVTLVWGQIEPGWEDIARVGGIERA